MTPSMKEVFVETNEPKGRWRAEIYSHNYYDEEKYGPVQPTFDEVKDKIQKNLTPDLRYLPDRKHWDRYPVHIITGTNEANIMRLLKVIFPDLSDDGRGWYGSKKKTYYKASDGKWSIVVIRPPIKKPPGMLRTHRLALALEAQPMTTREAHDLFLRMSGKDPDERKDVHVTVFDHRTKQIKEVPRSVRKWQGWNIDAVKGVLDRFCEQGPDGKWHVIRPIEPPFTKSPQSEFDGLDLRGEDDDP